MRNFIEGFLLFLALFLTGVDVKAMAANESAIAARLGEK